MKLLKCDNGHFYDGDKFATCPHCQGGVNPGPAAGGINLGEDVTIPINNMASTQPGNVGTWGTSPVDVTVPVTGGYGFGPAGDTVPLNDETDKTVPMDFVDDEKTQGIYTDTIPASPQTRSSGVAVDNAISAGWLICIKGVNVGRDYKVKLGRNSIGRDESNGIALLGDTSVSRTEQAIVVYEPHANKFYALPGRSTSLAYLNGEVLLARTEMKKNDVLELGKSELMLIPCCDEKFNWNSVFNS